MKVVNGSKLWQIVFASFILSIFIATLIYKTYNPKSVGNKQFPLNQKWETHTSNTIEDIFITDNKNIIARSAYSINLISLDTGELLWKKLIEKGTSSVRSLDGTIYLLGRESLLAFNEDTGEIVWEQKFNSDFIDGQITDVSKNYIAINFWSQSFEVYDTRSGNKKWVIPAGRGPLNAYINEEKLVTTDEYLQVYDLATGNLVWKDESTNDIGANIFENGKLYFSQNGNEIIAYDLATKKTIWKKRIELTGPYGLATFSIDEEALIVDDDTNAYIIDKATGIPIFQIEEQQPAFPQIVGNQLVVFIGFDRTIRSYKTNDWESTGTLRISPPTLLYVDKKILSHYGNTLIFFKNNKVYAYE